MTLSITSEVEVGEALKLLYANIPEMVTYQTPSMNHDWIQWGIASFFVAGERLEDGSLMGFAMARPIADPERAYLDQYYYDFAGKFIYVDALVSSGLERVKRLLQYGKSKFGAEHGIVFCRHGKYRVYRTNQLERLFK